MAPNLCPKCGQHPVCSTCDLPGVNAVRAQRGLPPWTSEQLEARLKERDPKTFARVNP